MMRYVFTHLFITDVLRPLLQGLRAFFYAVLFYLGHPLPIPFLTLYRTPARCCLCIRPCRGPYFSHAWMAVNINNI